MPAEAIEPGMVGAGVVDHRVEHEPHPAPAQRRAQIGQRRVAAEVRIDVVVVLGVVLVVAARGEDRVQVQRGDAELAGEVVELAAHADEVAAVERRRGHARIDRRAPRPGHHARPPGAVDVLVGRDRERRIALAEPIGEDLVDDLVGDPRRRRVRAAHLEVQLARRRIAVHAVGGEPALPAVVDHLERVVRGLVAAIPRRDRLVARQAVDLGDPLHRHQQLLVVGLGAQVDQIGRAAAQQRRAAAVRGADQPRRDRRMDQQHAAHRAPPPGLASPHRKSRRTIGRSIAKPRPMVVVRTARRSTGTSARRSGGPAGGSSDRRA